MTLRLHKSTLTAAVIAASVGMSSQAMSAGLLESLFGALRGAPPPQVQAYAPDPVTRFLDRLTHNERGREVASNQSGPSRGFCVRTCDGSYFPVQARAGLSAAEACNSFCPASETKVFSGSTIDSAISSDGRRYSHLPNAFAYRTQLKATCTCNGKAPGGLASLDTKTDPTLRPGDIVATGSGLVAFNGTRGGKTANFTPIDAARFNKAEREKLAAIKVVAPPEDEAPSKLEGIDREAANTSASRTVAQQTPADTLARR